jgi:lipopolysaccharide export system permease protein
MRTALTRGLAAGQFRSLGGGAVLYFRERDAQGLLHQVFFQRPVPDSDATTPAGRGKVEVMLADRASYSLSADGSVYTVVLHDGRRHEGVPGQGAWRNLSFGQLTVPIPVPTTTAYRGRSDMLSTSELLADPTPRNLGELHWRIATVCITLLLGVLAVPLARLRPRQGRYARVGWGVLLYALYANLLIVGRTLIEQGRIPGWLGLWWVHVVIGALALGLLWLPKVLHRTRLRMRGAAAPAQS